MLEGVSEYATCSSRGPNTKRTQRTTAQLTKTAVRALTLLLSSKWNLCWGRQCTLPIPTEFDTKLAEGEATNESSHTGLWAHLRDPPVNK